VEARPLTGRQHQIRVHLNKVGTWIVGDKLYGADPNCHLEYLETGWTPTLSARLILPRHALHAADLTFEHPLTGQPMRLTCPLSDDLRRFWDSLL
jgi:23S rRNA pseudouridine1911/1915/1917 synthase